jgi:hypothetical protein
MQILVNNIYSKIRSLPPQQKSVIHKALSIQVPKYHFMPSYRSGRWDGTKKFFHAGTGSFLTGLLPFILRLAREHRFPVQLVDQRALRPLEPLWEVMADPLLRGYQKSHLSGILRLTERDSGGQAVPWLRGIIKHPTGCLTGDTEIVVNRGGGAKRKKLRDIVRAFESDRRSDDQDRRRGYRKDIATKTASFIGDRLGLNTVVGAVRTGRKRVLKITTRAGRTLKATEEHKILTEEGWKTVGELTLNDRVMVRASDLEFEKKKFRYVVKSVVNHPYGIYIESDGTTRVPYHRLVMEASLSGLSTTAFMRCVRQKKHIGLKFLNPENLAVHHRDGNHRNNELFNLEVLPHPDHLWMHGVESGWKNLKMHNVSYDEVASIQRLRKKRQTYDLQLADPYNNYVANGIVVHNSGKTYFAAALILALHRRTLFVVGRRDLLYQTQTVLRQQLKRPIGIIGDSKLAIRAVTVGTVQTIAPRLRDPAMLDYLTNVDVLIFDEAHHVASGQYHDIAVRCPAYFRFGLSASPLSRGDTGDVTLIAHTGEIISELDRQELEETGWLSKAEIQLKTISEPRLPPRASYPAVYEQGIVKHVERNELIVEAAKAACQRGETVLILVRRTSHGKALRQACRATGLPTVYLRGSTSMEKRKVTLAKMRVQHLGTPFVVVATTIFDEGIDAPDIRCLILGGGGASRIKSIQRVGRGLRPKADGRNTLTVIDFVDRTHRFLLRHSDQRLAAYAEEGFTMTYDS